MPSSAWRSQRRATSARDAVDPSQACAQATEGDAAASRARSRDGPTEVCDASATAKASSGRSGAAALTAPRRRDRRAATGLRTRGRTTLLARRRGRPPSGRPGTPCAARVRSGRRSGASPRGVQPPRGPALISPAPGARAARAPATRRATAADGSPGRPESNSSGSGRLSGTTRSKRSSSGAEMRRRYRARVTALQLQAPGYTPSPHGQGFMAATRRKAAGNVTVPPARLTRITPSSSG